ncbi:MAG: hypothetical protein H6841_02675 [Planctomycetes bacterium]|nr:hypothetical protein [Planctomycetota bacterium]
MTVFVGCTTTVHRNVWFDDDGAVVRDAPPADSKLPAARADSFASVRAGLRVSSEEDVLGQPGLMVQAVDWPQPLNPEPLDLDVIVRVDGEPGSWIGGVRLFRNYRPLNVPKGTATLLRAHDLNWMGAELKSDDENHLTGDPDAPRVVADVYVEYWWVGREYVSGDKWYYILQFRSRLVSEHAEWEVSDSELELEGSGGLKLTVPLFRQAEPD